MPETQEQSAYPLSPTTEDYLKAIYKLGREEPVSTKALASELEVAAPSVTEMVKRGRQQAGSVRALSSKPALRAPAW
jgi:DNA-binding MarR family transcriptional regulator